MYMAEKRAKQSEQRATAHKLIIKVDEIVVKKRANFVCGTGRKKGDRLDSRAAMLEQKKKWRKKKQTH